MADCLSYSNQITTKKEKLLEHHVDSSQPLMQGTRILHLDSPDECQMSSSMGPESRLSPN